MGHEKFQIYALKIYTIIWHYNINSDYFWTVVYMSGLTLASIGEQSTNIYNRE